MSLFSRRDWQENFSFTRSILRDVAGQTSAPRDIGILAGTGINAGEILDGRAQSPKITPACHRPASAATRDSIRLLPLEGFVWGGSTLQPRARPEHALIWVTEGELRLDLPRQPGRMQAGDLRWIPAGTGFAASPMQAARGHVLLIRPEQMRDLLPRHLIAASAGAHATQMQAILHDLDVMVRQGANRNLLIRQLDLLLRVIAEMPPTHPRSAPGLTETGDTGLIGRFEELARTHLGPTVTVADLAEMLGCSAAALDRAAQEHRGKRAVGILNDIRLQRAIALLRDTRLSVARIALDTGFASHAHLARALCTTTGCRPEAFRNQRG